MSRVRLARPRLGAGTREYVRFSQPALTPTGDRASLYPSVRWIGRATRGSSPRARACTWQYDLNQPTAGAPDERASVAVPITSVDARARLRARLERLRHATSSRRSSRARIYIYIPFRNQNQLPVFDTVLDDFNFAQLFSENRFSAATASATRTSSRSRVTSRLLDPATGAERLRLAIGQRFYFEDQQVTLTGTPPQKAGSSDFLVGAEGRLSDAWSLIGLVQYNFGTSQTRALQRRHRATTRRPGKVLNLIYRYSRELVDQVGGQSQLKQTYLSGQWPLSRQLDVDRARGTTRFPTARRWRRWRASSTMAGAGRCASSASS